MLTPRLERLKKQIINTRPEVYAVRTLLVTEAYTFKLPLPSIRHLNMLNKTKRTLK